VLSLPEVIRIVRPPTAPTGDGRADHTVPLGQTGWRVWRHALLRAAGFPAGGPDRFAARDAAAAADALLADPGRAAGDPAGVAAAADGAGSGAAEGFAAAYDGAVRRIGAAVYDLAGDPLFREALTWQNPAAVDTMLDPVLAGGRDARRNSSRRSKEVGVLRYWSRYCLKNDTIGFFGPICWMLLDPDPTAPPVSAAPGPGLVRRRWVELERWALQAFADRVAGDPDARRWLPAAPLPMLALDGRRVWHPTRGEIPLSRAEAAVLARCDGVRPALAVAADVAADPAAGVRRPEDALLVLSTLAEKDLARWGIDLPVAIGAEALLRQLLAGIGDPALRSRVDGELAALLAGRDRVAAAAGDPAALRAALRDLDAEFVRLTGREPTQAAGRMYAGRTLCWEDTARDLDVVLGQRLLDELAEPLALLLAAARWLSAEMARVYLAELRGIYAELAAERGSADVPLAELWWLAQGLLYGPGQKPADAVAAEFRRRWARLLRLDGAAREVRLAAAELAGPVAAAFPADRPGWAGARYHSPDVHLLASDVDAVARGEFSFVLGELHASWNALDSALFVAGHPDRATLLAHQRRDLPTGRLVPLLPLDWPRITARTANGLVDPLDHQLGFVPAPGADLTRLIPTTALTVSDMDGELVAWLAGAGRWPLVEVFAELLAVHTVDAYKMFGSARHCPRVTIDRLVVAREAWRRSVSELDFAAVRDERDRYLAVRRWRRELDLPERVFVSIATETKPFAVDLTSPVSIAALCVSLRAAARDGGGDTPVTVTEMLPLPEHAWVPDAAGNRYASELRLLVLDPARSAWAAGQESP
jgi:hypothetical protein